MFPQFILPIGIFLVFVLLYISWISSAHRPPSPPSPTFPFASLHLTDLPPLPRRQKLHIPLPSFPTPSPDPCPICLEPLSTLPVARGPCNHIIHHPCLSSWLPRDPSCPVCRASFLPVATLKPLADDDVVSSSSSASDASLTPPPSPPPRPPPALPVAAVKRPLAARGPAEA